MFSLCSIFRNCFQTPTGLLRGIGWGGGGDKKSTLCALSTKIKLLAPEHYLNTIYAPRTVNVHWHEHSFLEIGD